LANRFLAPGKHFTVVCETVVPSWWSRSVLLGPDDPTASKFYATENPKNFASAVCWAPRAVKGVVLLIRGGPRHGILYA
jgi:hypothetical protein